MQIDRMLPNRECAGNVGTREPSDLCNLHGQHKLSLQVPVNPITRKTHLKSSGFCRPYGYAPQPLASEARLAVARGVGRSLTRHQGGIG